MPSWQDEVSKITYERIATVAAALPNDEVREEFAALLDDLQHNVLGPKAIRFVAIRRWLHDIGWPVQ